MARLAPALEDVSSFSVLWSGAKHYVCLFKATELSSCIASFKTTGNLETCTFFRRPNNIQKTSLESYKTQIKILPYPVLANRALNNPAQELRF